MQLGATLEADETTPNLLEDAIWHALTGSHQGFAMCRGGARKYPGEIAPFAAVEQRSSAAMADLRELMEPGETVYLLGPALPTVQDLEVGPVLQGLQMLFPADSVPPAPNLSVSVEELKCRDAAEMMELIAVAYPGFFRPRTCEMGRYYGVRNGEGQLVAMGGERLIVGECREISGLCTRPGYTGKGLGRALLGRLLADHRATGAQSWLQVTASNAGAIRLYKSLGFAITRAIQMQRIARLA